MFAITLDPLLGAHPLQNKGPEGCYKEMKYELIYSDSQKVNKRGSYAKSYLYPIPELN